MQTWQYRTFLVVNAETVRESNERGEFQGRVWSVQDALNDCGDHGWELVVQTKDDVLIFKKPADGVPLQTRDSVAAALEAAAQPPTVKSPFGGVNILHKTF